MVHTYHVCTSVDKAAMFHTPRKSTGIHGNTDNEPRETYFPIKSSVV
jgi:hypothetical protein